MRKAYLLGLFLAALFVAGLLAARPAAAQEADPLDSRAFDTFALGVTGVSQISQSEFKGQWSAPAGVDLFLSTPYYAGRTQIGVQIVPFSARKPELPDFTTYFLYAQWVNDLVEWQDVELYAGLRVGIYGMYFRDVDAMTLEQEVAGRAVMGLQYQWANWALYAQGAFGGVALSTPVYQGLITVGISHSFTTPAWLQELFL